MNYRIISYIIGLICDFNAGFMILPIITAIIYREKDITSFLIAVAICLAVGIPLTIKKPKNKVFYMKDGCVAVALGWIILCLSGSIPFVISDSIPNPIDAMFETVSGFTTTGSSIMTDVEIMPRCIIMWRSFTHWIGGMGVLVFILAMLPQSGGYHMNLMKAESPGPSVSKFVPKVQSTAKILYSIYFAMTMVQILLLQIGGMPLFDNLCITFGSAGTGGFGIKNDSMASYNTFCQVVTTIFMIAFGVNFSFYYLILTKKLKQAFKLEEVRWYLIIIAASILAIAINVRDYFPSFGKSIQQAAFQVGSIITTTGYSSTDFNQWPALSRSILVLLMFIGACAGSTGGGIKVSRIIILVKAAKKEFQLYLHPNAVKKIKMDDKPISHDVLRSTNTFLTLYLLIFSGSLLIVSLDGFDLVSNFSAVATTLNNIGPGLEVVGPLGNFSSYSYLSKCVFIFDMLAGRLEIFPLLLLFFKDTWKKF